MARALGEQGAATHKVLFVNMQIRLEHTYILARASPGTCIPWPMSPARPRMPACTSRTVGQASPGASGEQGTDTHMVVFVNMQIRLEHPYISPAAVLDANPLLARHAS